MKENKEFRIKKNKGKIKWTCHYLNGKRHGEYKSFRENGNLLNVYEYENGKLNGCAKLYSNDGYVLISGTFVNGKLDGEYIVYNAEEKGSCLYKYHYFYKKGKKDGEYKHYSDDGKLDIHCFFKKDKLNGVYKKYDKDGNLEIHSLFKGGKLIEHIKENKMKENKMKENKMKENKMKENKMNTVEQTLEERNRTHGKYENVSLAYEHLKQVLLNQDMHTNKELNVEEKMAIDMIFMKLSRILNGAIRDDSWHDIAGYATLAEKSILEKESK